MTFNNSDYSETESRSILDKLNQYFSRDEPKVGYGKIGENVLPLAPKPASQVPTNFLDDNLIQQANSIYDYYDSNDLRSPHGDMEELKERLLTNFLQNTYKNSLNQLTDVVNYKYNKFEQGGPPGGPILGNTFAGGYGGGGGYKGGGGGNFHHNDFIGGGHGVGCVNCSKILE